MEFTLCLSAGTFLELVESLPSQALSSMRRALEQHTDPAFRPEGGGDCNRPDR